MKKKVFFMLLAGVIFVSYGQNNKRSVFPDGFHIGITGEGNLAQKMTVVAIGKNYPAPISDPTLGWQAGIEFSYHFAKHYGVSIGFDYGTEAQYRRWRLDSDGYYMPIGPSNARYAFNKFQIPIKVEFHYPILKSDFFLYSAVGVNLMNVRECVLSKILGYNPFNLYINESGHYPTDAYRGYLEDRNGDKIRVDLQLNIGFYYRLPYNDLIRFSVLANYATKDTFHGMYEFLQIENAFGSYCYRHNHVGLELAYIHCFRKKTNDGKRKQNKGLQ